MLEIRIETSGNHIKSYSAMGHSNNTCGVVSSVSRTFVMLAKDIPGVTVKCDAPREGELSFEVFKSDLSLQISVYLAGFSQFLLKAIYDLGTEFPDEVKVIIKNGV
jgi:uncharacterized protein YsxB (DUF464 family)